MDCFVLYCVCPVLSASHLYGRQDSLRARKGESPGPCTFGSLEFRIDKCCLAGFE